jgi:chorismate mutase/prephenate dehydratase
MSDTVDPSNSAAAHPTPDQVVEIREDIDAVDRQLLALLAQRRRLAKSIIDLKDISRIPVRDPHRESHILNRLIAEGRSSGLDAHFVSTVFERIIDDSIRLQQEHLHARASQGDHPDVIRVAVQGIRGAYSYSAAQTFFSKYSERLAMLECTSFADAFRSVEDGKADYAVVPIENTTSGSINEVYDLLLHTRLSIVGEEKLSINHCLMAPAATPLAELHTILSHPQALQQCGQFLSSLPCRVESFGDTARAARRVQEDNDPGQAAIASEPAAETYGLTILKRDITNKSENFTRFIVAARQAQEVTSRIPCKTSLVMATAQTPGALVEALMIFKDNDLNMTKLESRPMHDNPWEEMFYVDCAGNLADAAFKTTMEQLARVTRFVKILGCYPATDIPPIAQVTPPPASTADKTTTASKPSATAPAPKGYKLVSRQHKEDDTIITVGSARIGGEQFTVIAGPCSVESREQIMTCAREARQHGAAILRGGCFKPRSSPYSFQGLGYEGLDLLVEAGERHGLPIITEVLSPQDVQKVAQRAHILQIGARNMQNFSLLKEVGATQRPVMLKRGLMSSVEELLQAAEYILAHGNQQVILCERGIRTFETATRNTLDLSAVPILRSRTHLPIIVDPSHAAGERDLVPPLCRAARAIGAHGIMIEMHPEPEKALSDGPQALRLEQFEALMAEFRD